jgi:bifunctional non-homologous end joining protein LigD
VFDVLFVDGRDVRSLPLMERRRLLRSLKIKMPVAVVPELEGDAPWERACKDGWEGVIAKRRDSPYESRRSPHWLKMKCEATQELVIGGFTDPQGARVGLGALLVGYFEKGDFVFAGKVGTGLDTTLLTSLRARLDALSVPKPPFTKGTGLPKLRTHWVRAEIVVQVAFTEWTPYDKLRHPRLLGLRPDKKARDVVRERP